MFGLHRETSLQGATTTTQPIRNHARVSLGWRRPIQWIWKTDLQQNVRKEGSERACLQVEHRRYVNYSVWKICKLLCATCMKHPARLMTSIYQCSDFYNFFLKDHYVRLRTFKCHMMMTVMDLYTCIPVLDLDRTHHSEPQVAIIAKMRESTAALWDKKFVLSKFKSFIITLESLGLGLTSFHSYCCLKIFFFSPWYPLCFQIPLGLATLINHR